ncbi:MAG: DNA polymerase IV [Peptococcaceae bacterium]|jgi:DNA polymerase-4|nr:DNA polymerase IV [Peptococcaceae bacterium]
MGERVILHVDMNAFYASVEALFHPETAGKPMAVCGDPQNRRGVILAKNDLAKKAGVKTGEPIWEARSKCPGLILLPPHHDLYGEYCVKANEIYGRFTDLVEMAGVDESYLDVTGSAHLFGSGRDIADQIRQVVRQELGLTVSVGVSFCKVFAKLGSDYQKPDATTVISRENYREILYPLPVTDLMYVGRTTAGALRDMGVTTIGQLAELDETRLVSRLGKHGRSLFLYARGLEREPVQPAWDREDIKSVGNGITFRRDLISERDIRTGLRALSESVAYRLRKKAKKCLGVQVTIKDPAFKTIDRQVKLPCPCNSGKNIYDAALELIFRSWEKGKPIRLLTVTAINLVAEDENVLVSLFDNPARDPRLEALDRSVDRLKGKYGKGIIKPASLLNNDLGINS